MLGFLWAFIGAVFGAGVMWGTMGAKVRKNQVDVNGLGKIVRDERGKADRRWKHDLANDIEELEPKDRAARIAKRLREDAWRD